MIGGRRGVRRTCARPLRPARPARPAAGPACRRMPGSCPSSSSPSTSQSSVLRPSQSPVPRPHATRVRVRSVRSGRDKGMPRHALKRRGGQSRGREGGRAIGATKKNPRFTTRPALPPNRSGSRGRGRQGAMPCFGFATNGRPATGGRPEGGAEGVAWQQPRSGTRRISGR